MKRTLLLFALLLSAAPAFAQPNTTAIVNTRININQVIRITGPTAIIDFVGDETALTNGFTSSVTSSIQHQGNVPHSVSLTAPAQFTNTSGLVKAGSDFQYSLDAGTSWAGVSTAGASVVSGAARGAHTLPVRYRILLSWADDEPGVYTLPLTYTISAD